jgi:hypothetical protein
MVVNDNAHKLDERSALEFFASKLAPTGSYGDDKSQAKKSPISLKRSIGLEHSGATSAKGGSMRVWT